MSSTPDLASFAAEARYARERLDLYRAKTYGSRPTSEARLRELERACAGAQARLRRAQEAVGSSGGKGAPR